MSTEDSLSYLPTQVVFEYIGTKYSREIDGVLFSSVQTNGAGTNIALFPEYSGVIREGKLDKHGEENPFARIEAKIYLVNDSLVYHHIKSISVVSHDEDHPIPFVVDEITRKRLFPQIKL